jgi:hypothetical protein
MKVYRISLHDPDMGRLLGWASSKAQAKRAARQLADAMPSPQEVESVSIVRIDIPTDRAGLIRWLNDNFISDNG